MIISICISVQLLHLVTLICLLFNSSPCFDREGSRFICLSLGIHQPVTIEFDILPNHHRAVRFETR